MIGCAGGRPPELGKLAVAAPPFYGCTGRHDFNHREMRDSRTRLPRCVLRDTCRSFRAGMAGPTRAA